MTDRSSEKTYQVLTPFQFVSSVAMGALGGLGLVAIVGVVLFASVTGEMWFLRRYGEFLTVFGGVCLIVVSSIWMVHYAAREVTVEPDGLRIKRSFRQEVFLRFGEIQSLAPFLFIRSIFQVQYRGDKFILSFGFDGFHEVLSAVRRLNPGAKIKGC